MKIVLMSDTHGVCDKKIEKYLSDCDEIWHAGDIGSLNVVNRLRSFAPLRAVHGNIDGQDIRYDFPEFLSFQCEGASILMTHIGGFPGKYHPKALQKIVETQYIASQNKQYIASQKTNKIFICGHSHILRVIYDQHFDMLTLNPGAAGLQGFHQVRTLLRFEITNGEIQNLEVIEIPR